MCLLNKLIGVVIVALSLSACSDEFLNESIGEDEIGMGESAMYISPDWDAGDYTFSCPIAKTIKFSIIVVPSWLELESTEGNLYYTPPATDDQPIRSVGTLRAKANFNKAFEKVGIYLEYMTVKAGSVYYKIPVFYVTEGNPSVEIDSVLEYSFYSYEALTVEIANKGEGILFWDIISMPEWLKIDMNQVLSQSSVIRRNGIFILPLVFNPEADMSGNQLEGVLVLRTNDKKHPEVTIQVIAEFGNPKVFLSGLTPTKIDLTNVYQGASIYVINNGEGLLTWQFSNLPEWLTLSKSKGMIRSYNSEEVVFTTIQSKLNPGINKAVIKLYSNDVSGKVIDIEVIARGEGNNASTFAIEGNVVDAVVDKSKNRLIYAVSQPNKLVFFDMDSKSVEHEITLGYSPTCFTMAEDFSSAIVGHGGRLSVINLINYSVEKVITVNQNVFDVAWSDSASYYFSELAYNSDEIFLVDSKKGSVTAVSLRDVDGKTILKKVPGDSFIIGTRRQTSPSGFFAFNTAENKLQSYAHKDLYDCWFSEDGIYIYARTGDIYRTSTATDATDTFNATVNPIAVFSQSGGDNTRFYPLWADHCHEGNKIFIINNDYQGLSLIYQFDDIDYKLFKSIIYDKYYQYQQTGVRYEVKANYVFSNRSGSEVAVLKKAKDNPVWAIEFLSTSE